MYWEHTMASTISEPEKAHQFGSKCETLVFDLRPAGQAWSVTCTCGWTVTLERAHASFAELRRLGEAHNRQQQGP